MNKESKEDRLTGLYILLGLVFLTWLASMFIVRWKFANWPTRGTFGDSFGAINSLFSGLALGGIIYTIFLQKKELALQRDELRETRNEFKIQNATLKTQRFENTFFNLLGLHHQIIEGIDYDTQIAKKDGTEGRPRRIMEKRDYEIVTIKGRDVFKNKFELLIEYLSKAKLDFNAGYLTVYSTVQTDLGHYFRNLYRIIKFVNETEFFSIEELDIPINSSKYEDRIKHEVYNHSERYKYTSMIRAQLSDYELLWLFYNCLSDNGIEKFKPLIEKYTIFKNLPKDKVHDQSLIGLYEQKAFEKN